ncbi:hypothetical protein Tco_0613617 [Tanacetum coccineum]
MVAYLKKPTGCEGFQEIVDFLNGSYIRTVDNGEQGITATIDGKEFTITEASVRRHLPLAYVDAEEGEGSGHPSEPQPPPSTAQPNYKEPIPNVKVPTPPYDSPLPRVNTLGSDEGSMTLLELTVLCTTLSKKVESLEADLKQTKKVYGAAYTKLIKKVKKLEKTVKSNQARRRAKIVVSDDEEDLEDSSKQGRMIEEIDQDAGVTLVTPTHSQEDQPEDQLGVFSAAKVLADVAKENVYIYTRRRRAVSTGKESVNTVGSLMTVVIKDKEERKRIARVHEEVSSFNIKEWEDIQATIKPDEELAQRMQAEEREKYSKAEKARLLAELINQRKRYFTQQRAEERRNKPLTLSFDELKNLFEATMRRVGAFVPIETKIRREVPELAARSTKRDAEEELDQGSSKRQKTSKNSEPAEESKEKENDKLSQEELQQLMIIVPEERMNVEALVGNHTEKSQKHVHDITWRLYDTCGVHHVSTKDGINIYMIVEKEYPLSRGVLTQMLAAKLLVEQNNKTSRELLRKILMMAERPRR